MNDTSSATPPSPSYSSGPDMAPASAPADRSDAASTSPGAEGSPASSLPSDALPDEGSGKPLNSKIADIIEKIISHIPDTNEPTSNTPEARSRHIISRASMMAGVVSGGLAIPPGPLAFATLLPDLYAIWKIQSQMVADIASAYGRKADLRREHMLYCLFRHITSQVARDIAVRVGQRILIRPGSVAIMNRIFSLIGREVTQRIAARTASSWVPLFGAAAVGGYAWYDTRKVGHTAMVLFAPSAPSAAQVAGMPSAGNNVAVGANPDPAAPTLEELAAGKSDAPPLHPAPPHPVIDDSDLIDIDGFVDLPPLPPAQHAHDKSV